MPLSKIVHGSLPDQGITLPQGTTAERPSNPIAGNFRFNTTLSSIEFWNGSAWLQTHLIPVLSAVSGNLTSGTATTLTLTVSSTTSTINVVYKVGNTEIARTNGVSVSSGSASTTAPSGVQSQSVGTTVIISIENNDVGNTASPTTQSLTVGGIATGGTVTTYSSGGTNYKVHKFTSSGTLTVPSGLTLSNVTCVACAGGAGSGAYGNGGGGGGGGGGGSTGSYTISSITAGSYTITVGAGGAQHGTGGDTILPSTFQGDLGTTHFNGGTLKGGNRGGYGSNAGGLTGGNGGGGNPRNGSAGGRLIAGQGNIGGYVGALNQNDNGAAGGGGFSAAGGNAAWTNSGAGGGTGLMSNIADGSIVVQYSGGGKGGNGTYHGNTGRNGTAHIGEGGWGPKAGIAGYAGGSGVVIFRYEL